VTRHRFVTRQFVGSGGAGPARSGSAARGPVLALGVSCRSRLASARMAKHSGDGFSRFPPGSLEQLGAQWDVLTVERGVAWQNAAGTLLDKAVRAVRAGDDDRARRYVARAVALPFDDHERCAVAEWAATMLVSDALVEAMEDATPDDPAWLDAAEAVLADCDPHGGRVLREELRSVTRDHRLSRPEAARCRSLVSAGGTEPEQWYIAAGARGIDERVDALMGVVVTAARYQDALDRASTAEG
jgi:hypothetical protein